MAHTRSRSTAGDILLRRVQCGYALPAAFLLSLCALVLYAGARLGFWPIAHLNDPKDIGVSYVIFCLLILALLLGFLIAALFTPQRGPGIRSAGSAVSWSAPCIVLWALFILVVKLDPGRYIEWILD